MQHLTTQLGPATNKVFNECLLSCIALIFHCGALNGSPDYIFILCMYPIRNLVHVTSFYLHVDLNMLGYCHVKCMLRERAYCNKSKIHVVCVLKR